MDLGYDVVVMVTGIVLVFFILVLLMLIISVEGKVFDSMNNAKKEAEKKKAEQSAPAAPAVSAAQAEQPAVEEGIPGEVVAAIAAAIAMISGGKYTLRAVRRANGDSRGNWGRAGTGDVTAPF